MCWHGNFSFGPVLRKYPFRHNFDLKNVSKIIGLLFKGYNLQIQVYS